MKKVVLATLGILSSVLIMAPAQSENVPEVLDFAALGKEADQLPILLMFAATTCEYCERLEEEQLGPMIKSGNYLNRVVIRKHILDKVGYIKNFKGEAVSYTDFADSFDVDLTPTIMFLDKNGNKVHKNIYGYNGSDFFASRLDQAIAGSHATIKRQSPSMTKLSKVLIEVE